LAFIQAFSYAFIVITLLLWLILRSIKEVGIVLSPLILAGLLTSATSVVLSIPFNFANIIALPLLLGIGVDSALHILHRYKTALPENGNLLQTSTARAVFFSALTTTVSFGNLAGSTHAGTASMGVMLAIGVVSTLICTLVVLPALLKLFLPRQPR
jgi:predicted RND superfamily exporter protein